MRSMIEWELEVSRLERRGESRDGLAVGGVRHRRRRGLRVLCPGAPEGEQCQAAELRMGSPHHSSRSPAAIGSRAVRQAG